MTDIALVVRPAVKRWRIVNRMSGDPPQRLRERHGARDVETGTQAELTEGQG